MKDLDPIIIDKIDCGDISLRMKTPLYLVPEYREGHLDYYVVRGSKINLNLLATGRTRDELIQNIKNDIVLTYTALKRLEGVNLETIRIFLIT